MHSAFPPNTRPHGNTRGLPLLVLALHALACDRPITLENDTEGTVTDTDIDLDIDVDPSTDTGPLDSDSGDGPEPDLPDPPSISCAPDAGDLVSLWTREDINDRGDALAVGAGMIAWTGGDVEGLSLKVLDLDGTPLWAQSIEGVVPGSGEQSYVDLAIGPSGDVVLAASVHGMAHDGALHWFDAGGGLLGTHHTATAEAEGWRGLAVLPGEDVVAVGESVGDVLVQRFSAPAVAGWSQTYDGPGSVWASDVAVTPDGRLVVSGYSDALPGPVLIGYEADGSLSWVHHDEGGPALEIAMSVAVDALGRTWMTVHQGDDDGRVERFDATGLREAMLPLDFRPNAIAIDLEGVIVIAGGRPTDDIVVVERRSASWDLLAHHERPGPWAMGVAVDDECHTYVVGSVSTGSAFLDKLR